MYPILFFGRVNTLFFVRYKMLEQLFILLFFPLISTVKVVIQGICAKSKIKTQAQASLINSIIFLITGVLMLALFCRTLPSAKTVIYAIAFGVFSVGFQLMYIAALRTGSVGLTMIVNNLAVIPPTIMGAVLYGEIPSFIQIIGIVLLFVALLFLSDHKSSSAGVSKIWFISALFCMLSNSGTKCVQILFSKSTVFGESTSFVALSYFFAAALSLILYFIFKKKDEPKIEWDIKLTAGLILIGIILGVYNYLWVIALTKMPSFILIVANSCLCLVFAWISDRIFFKKKATKNQIISVVLALISAILTNIK